MNDEMKILLANSDYRINHRACTSRYFNHTVTCEIFIKECYVKETRRHELKLELLLR